MASPIASTRTVSTGGNIPDYMSGLGQYAIPQGTLGSGSGNMVGDALSANISSAPALEKIANIVSQINQQSYLSAPGRQQELANINRWQAGELDPSIYADVASKAAQMYGTGGFGVDSPAWQSAVQRAIVTNRQALQEKGASELEKFYAGMPATDVTKYTITPSDYASAQDAARARQLQLAQIQQTGALKTAEMNQARALAQQELAFKQSQKQQANQLAQAELYAKYGYRGLPGAQDWMTDYLADQQANWAKYGYAGPPVIR